MVRITKENVEQFLDAGLLYAHMTNGNWWRVRRNGQTRRWKLDRTRISIPIKAGVEAFSRIIEGDFNNFEDLPPALNPEHFRHADDLPQVKVNWRKRA